MNVIKNRFFVVSASLAILASTLAFVLVFEPKQRPPTPTLDSKPAKKLNEAQTPTALSKKDDLDQLLIKQVGSVVDQLELLSKFPSYSVPVFDDNPLYEPAPYEFNATNVSDYGEGSLAGLSLSIATNNHIYRQDETVIAKLNINGVSPTDYHVIINASMVSMSSGSSSTVLFNPVGTDGKTYQADIAPYQILSIDGNGEMLLHVQAVIGERRLNLSTAFEVSNAEESATVIDVTQASVEGSNLLIPVNLSVEKPGWYQAQAVLRDSESGRPLAVLEASDKYEIGNATLVFKAHISALKFKKSPGPYRLSLRSFTRLATLDEVADVNGHVPKKNFEIKGVPFANYENDEAQNDLLKQQLGLFETLGN